MLRPMNNANLNQIPESHNSVFRFLEVVTLFQPKMTDFIDPNHSSEMAPGRWGKTGIDPDDFERYSQIPQDDCEVSQ